MAFHISVAPGLAADVGPELTAELQAAARAFHASAHTGRAETSDGREVRVVLGARLTGLTGLRFNC